MRALIAGIALGLAAASPAAAFSEGDWVLAQWKGGEYWFPGVVESASGGKVTVAFDDGTRETRPSNQVRDYDWRVGSKVECNWKGQGWYRGKITALSGEKLSIAYDDGDKETTKTGRCRSN